MLALLVGIVIGGVVTAGWAQAKQADEDEARIDAHRRLKPTTPTRRK